jgi:uncharacterized protein YaaN involved in tellurite resistance
MTDMLTPPDATELTLVAPEPVKPVETAAVPGMLPAISAERELKIGDRAKEFVKDLATVNPNAPEFIQKLADIQSLAQKEVTRSGNGTSRLLERKSTSMAGSKKSGGDASQKVAGTLSTLRSTVEDLVPNAADFTVGKKILGFIPGGNKVRKYFQRYETAQVQLDTIVKNLLSGQDELMKDNASLQQEKEDLWENMGALNEYVVLAQKIDEEVSHEIERLRNAGNVEAARTMESDMLFAIRQRRQDLMTQLAVSVQGYMAMELVRKNNVELIKGVDRARTTTIYALKTAIVVAQALDTQKLVLDQIDAVNSATNKTIEQTSIMLRQQTGRVHEQAANSGVTVATLERAFENIFATMDEIDTFKQRAVVSMDTTLDGLGNVLQKASGQLDRARALEAAETGAGRQQSITK